MAACSKSEEHELIILIRTMAKKSISCYDRCQLLKMKKQVNCSSQEEQIGNGNNQKSAAIGQYEEVEGIIQAIIKKTKKRDRTQELITKGFPQLFNDNEMKILYDEFIFKTPGGNPTINEKWQILQDFFIELISNNTESYS